MARQSVCPECGSHNIYYDIGSVPGNIGYRNYIFISKGILGKSTPLDVCVCGDCGYVRTFVAQQESLDRIKKTWNKLSDAE